MPSLILLGTGAAFNDGSREPTMLAVCGEHSTIVIDCGANAIAQLQRAGVPLASIERLILTHSHADHTSGFGLLLEMLWLAGRREPLPIHGPAEAIDVARRLFDQWDTSGWEGLPERIYHEIPLTAGAAVADGADFEITAAPGTHSVPVVGLRFRERATGAVLVYGADGEPSAPIRELARDADLLVHEATGPWPGHSSAEGAATLAREAGARRLVLVHLAPNAIPLADLHAEATAAFHGELVIGEDLARLDW